MPSNSRSPFHHQRRTRVVGQHEDRHLIHGILAPPAAPAFIRPRAAHAEYQARFVRRYRIVDAMEIFLKSDADIILGFSMLRHDAAPAFSPEEIQKAEALRTLGNFALSRTVPRRQSPHLSGAKKSAPKGAKLQRSYPELAGTTQPPIGAGPVGG